MGVHTHLYTQHAQRFSSAYTIFCDTDGSLVDIEGDGDKQAIVLARQWNMGTGHAFFQVCTALHTFALPVGLYKLVTNLLQTHDCCDVCDTPPGNTGRAACCVSCQKVYCLGHFKAHTRLVREKNATLHPLDFVIICADCHAR